MIRPQWRNPHAATEGQYGLGIMSGQLNGWDWFGHSGGLLGYVSRTATLPKRNLAISVLTNANDGWAGFWLDGILHILRTFESRGAPARRVSGWTGRWWSPWGAADLVPMGETVVVANPQLGNPFVDAAEIEVSGRNTGRLDPANGYNSYGETVRRQRNASGQVSEIWLGGTRLRPEAEVAADLQEHYGSTKTP
jgi:hypothetical protein